MIEIRKKLLENGNVVIENGEKKIEENMKKSKEDEENIKKEDKMFASLAKEDEPKKEVPKDESKKEKKHPLVKVLRKILKNNEVNYKEAEFTVDESFVSVSKIESTPALKEVFTNMGAKVVKGVWKIYKKTLEDVSAEWEKDE